MNKRISPSRHTVPNETVIALERAKSATFLEAFRSSSFLR